MMYQAIFITCIVIFLNTLFFLGGLNDFLLEQGPFLRAALRTLCKVLIYVGPVCSVVFFLKPLQKGQLGKFLRSLFKRSHTYRVYALRLIWFVGLIAWGKEMSIQMGTYSLFYVLLVNSVVEETVFRGYIQEKLVKEIGKIRGIIGQAVLFGLVHLPFYYMHYQAGLYDHINQMMGGILSNGGVGVGPIIILLVLGTPILLGVIWGRLTDKTQSLWPSIILHSIHNGVLFFL